MGIKFFLARRYLLRGKARHLSFVSIIAVLGVMLGVATLVIVTSVMNGFDRDLTDKLLNFNYHVFVESSSEQSLLKTREIMRQTSGVETVTLLLHTQVFARFGDYIMPLSVKGIDFGEKKETEIFKRFIEKDYNPDGKGFFVGQGLADRFFIGDSIEFYPLDKKLKLVGGNVRGIFKTGLYDLDNNYLISDLTEAKELGENYFMQIGARLDNPFEAGKFKRELIEGSDGSIMVRTWFDTNRALFAALKLEKITMFLILSLIVLVATFSIFTILMVKVAEKTKDIGVLKTIGFTSGEVKQVFIFQGLILSGMGLLLGLGLGTGICYLLQEYHFIQIPRDVYYIDYLPVYVNYKDIIAISSVCLILSLAASIIPADRASRLSVCEALRYE